MTGRLLVTAVAALVAWLIAAETQAQPLGTFRWQLQPFCNVVTVNVIQQGAVYTVDGFDDQCGAPQRAPLVGLATPNPDGSIGLGLQVVTVPSGRGLQIDARMTLATLSGSWRDSAGNSGTLAFGASTGGSPRPAPTVPGSAIAAGTITSGQLAATIFGGTGVATTVARSDHLHDDRYYTKAQADASKAAVIEGPGVFTPATLTVQYDHAAISEVVVTPKAGHLLISKFIRRSFVCASGGHLYFLTVDGVPVRSSAAFVPGQVLEFAGFLSGATVGVVASGSHTLSVGSQCVSGAYTGAGGHTVSNSSVVVLP